jgi:hypothetical protein
LFGDELRAVDASEVRGANLCASIGFGGGRVGSGRSRTVNAECDCEREGVGLPIADSVLERLDVVLKMLREGGGESIVGGRRGGFSQDCSMLRASSNLLTSAIHHRRTSCYLPDNPFALEIHL